MAKRFTDTDKWKRPWFRELATKPKLIWNYLCDQCDHAGIWPADFGLMEFCTGIKTSEQDLKEWFGDKIVKVASDKFCIPSFYEFQYADAKDGFKAKQSAIKTLTKYGFTINSDGSLTNPSEQLPNTSEVSMDNPSIGIRDRMFSDRISEIGVAIMYKGKFPPQDHELAHVIEYSALEQANAKIAILEAAVKEIAKDFGTDACDGNTMIAQEALAEYERIGK